MLQAVKNKSSNCVVDFDTGDPTDPYWQDAKHNRDTVGCDGIDAASCGMDAQIATAVNRVEKSVKELVRRAISSRCTTMVMSARNLSSSKRWSVTEMTNTITWETLSRVDLDT